MDILKYYIKKNIDINDNQLDEITSHFQLKTVKRNSVLLSAGETCKELYIVNSGCIRTYYITKQGHEKTRYIAFEGTIVTSLASFISQQSSFEFMDAIEDTELFVIRHNDFNKLLVKVPAWETFYRKILEMAYIYQNKRIESLVTLTAKQRYDKLLKENPEYFQRLSNKILATYLDITQETLSRLKSK
jgi:CRP-like cAMP-binding protein